MEKEKAVEIFQNLKNGKKQNQKLIYEAYEISINAINQVKKLENQLKLTELALRVVVSGFSEDCNSCLAKFNSPCPVLDRFNRRGSNDCIKAILKTVEKDKRLWEINWEET